MNVAFAYRLRVSACLALGLAAASCGGPSLESPGNTGATGGSDAAAGTTGSTTADAAGTAGSTTADAAGTAGSTTVDSGAPADAVSSCGTWMGFTNPIEYGVAVDPLAVAIADLDGDHHPDLAVSTIFGGANVLLNKGDGTFRTRVEYMKGIGTSIAIGDLNGDGHPDMAAINSGLSASMIGSDTVSVFLNKGDGSFAAPVDYGTGRHPFSVVIGDLNKDGKLDLAVANVDDDTGSVLLNQGSGTFAGKVDYPVGMQPWALAIGDLDGDGDLDLASANYTGTMSVMLNQGAGTFAAPASYATGTQPLALAIADLDGDGKNDVAVANSIGSTVSVLLNAGNGMFPAHVDHALHAGPTSIAIGDLNGDAKPDLVLTTRDDNSAGVVSVLLNKGGAKYTTRTDFEVGRGPSAVALGDLDGDGRLDLAVAENNTSSVSVMLNQGCQ